MAKSELDSFNFIGLDNNVGYTTLPIQTLKFSQKGKPWRKRNMDVLEQIGLNQLSKNSKFVSYRNMSEGQFTYAAVGIEEDDMPWFKDELKKLKVDRHVPNYLKHFDFIGIVVNAISSIYNDIEDKFMFDSRDEYFTNELIRTKTEMLHTYARQVFLNEVNAALQRKGFDPFKEDFTSQEEYDQYQQQKAQEVQALTPPEIEKFLTKNFNVIATEWAQETINEDNKRFGIRQMDVENFIDLLLTGRYFKHFRVGYDTYTVERWKPEETFFSEDVDARYPQDGEYAGRITNMSISSVLSTYGHLMTTKQQEEIGNYWNQNRNYETVNGASISESGKPIEEKIFPEPTVVPFHNYFDHKAIIALEDASGIPLSETTIKDDEGNDVTFNSWTPRMEEDEYRTDLYSSYLRNDIDVRTDTIRVTEAYWRSYKRLAVLIFTNDLGSISVELTTDDLLEDFLKENEIKKLRNISLQDLQVALKEERLSEYNNTITYIYTPEIWHGIKIRSNGSTVKKDLYLDVRPLDYQIKGESEFYDVKIPVVGYIGVGIAIKLAPYQQLHNIAMNQITELLEKELGVFFAFDITGFPSEYQDETTEEAVFRARDIIRDTGMLGLDLSRQNTQGNSPNVFQRHEVVYATQVQYRWTLAQQYKQEALNQVGITPQILGQPINYQTAEGVKQGAQASYALINPYFEKMNEAKSRELEVHVAVAQYCQYSGKDSTVMFRKNDQELRFLDILAEDGEIFPLRKIGVYPTSSSKDRKIVENLQNLLINDNTLSKNFEDALAILTNPTIVELQQIAKQMTAKTERQTQEQRQFEQQQLEMQLQAVEASQEKERQHEQNLKIIDGQVKIKVAEINSVGRLSDNETINQDLLDRIEKTAQGDINNDFRQQEIDNKLKDVDGHIEDKRSQRLIELEKLDLKRQELNLRQKGIEATKFNSIINKN